MRVLGSRAEIAALENAALETAAPEDAPLARDGNDTDDPTGEARP